MNKYSEFVEKFVKLSKPSEKVLVQAKSVLEKTADMYYNTGKESPLTDEEWDNLERHYSKFKKHTAGAKPKEGKRLVDVGHIFPELVGTLHKTNFVYKIDKGSSDKDTVEEWFDRTGISGSRRIKVAISDKKDGNSVTLTFDENDKVIMGLTRGKDGKGADVTSLFKKRKSGLKKIPRKEMVGIKYEAIVSDDNFEKVSELIGKTFANARSMVAGILGSSDGHKYSDYIDLVPIRIQYANNPITREDELGLLKQLNSQTGIKLNIEFLGGTRREIIKLIKETYDYYINEYRQKLDHPIDGLVVEILDQDLRDMLGRDEDRNNYDFALKFPYMVKKSTVTGMRYDYGKTARITPVVQFKPVYFSGAKCENVSLANYKRFKELGLKVGDTVLVEYRNDVLAYVHKDPNSKVEGDPIKFINKCPKCGEKLKLTSTKVFAYCGNPTCEGKLSGRVENWFIKLGIKGVKASTIQKIIDADLIESIPDLYDIKKADLLGIDGFLEKTADNILIAIHSKTRIYDWELLGSLSFKDAGRKTFKLVFKEMTLNELLQLAEENYNTAINRLRKISGIETTTAENIINGIEENQDTIDRLTKFMAILSFKEEMEKNLSGKKYSLVFTGFRDPEMQSQLESKGHSIKGSVSGNTDILVVKDTSSAGSKYKKAQDLGKMIFTLAEFKIKIYNKLIKGEEI
jgi:DNA ligase (NAD+)